MRLVLPLQDKKKKKRLNPMKEPSHVSRSFHLSTLCQVDILAYLRGEKGVFGFLCKWPPPFNYSRGRKRDILRTSTCHCLCVRVHKQDNDPRPVSVGSPFFFPEQESH